MLADADFRGPISLHMEYTVPGVSTPEGIALSRGKCDEMMVAAKQNLEILKALVHEAYEGA
jgi:hypothetical protein